MLKFHAVIVIILWCCVFYIVRGMATSTVPKYAYVAARLQRCTKVKKESTCGVNHRVPDYFARQYNYSLKVITDMLRLTDRSRGCREIFRKLLCSQSFPRCSKSKKTLDFGNATSLCAQMLNNCSKGFAKREKGRCQTVQSGMLKLNECVAMKPDELGNCTAKHRWVPVWIPDRYRLHGAQSVTKIVRPGSRLAKCRKRLPGSLCKIPFCSADKKYVLNTYTRQDCRSMTRCLSHPRGSPVCRQYPNKNRARRVPFM